MNPVHTILHVGTNDQPTWKNYDEIAKSILQLGSALKAKSWDVSISSIMTASD